MPVKLAKNLKEALSAAGVAQTVRGVSARCWRPGAWRSKPARQFPGINRWLVPESLLPASAVPILDAGPPTIR